MPEKPSTKIPTPPRSREEIAKDAVRRLLESYGWTVLGVSMNVSHVEKGEGQYGQKLVIKFDGSQE